MESMDQYYLLNGKLLSTFREIEKVVEKSRIEVLISTNALENIMNSNVVSPNCQVDFIREKAILENEK
ncbi:hypothetical protein HHI36_005726 [Cryptolaemus montrouzieri]|uniref:Uncharacterized protein n=1 Tax=Cryptolaemus montrouzieri TaxID=559131 RepID=A0ABD2NUY9_9CUCU